MNIIKILFLSVICALKSYSFHHVKEGQLKILDSGNFTTLKSKCTRKGLAIIMLFNRQNKERILLNRRSDDSVAGNKNFDLLNIFIKKSNPNDLEAYIVTSDKRAPFVSDIISLLSEKGVSCHTPQVDYYFEITLSASIDGILEIIEPDEYNLNTYKYKLIAIDTSNYEAKKESLTDAIEKEFKNTQLANLEKIKTQANNSDDLINKRIFNSESLSYLIKNNMKKCSSRIGEYGIANFTYFDVLKHEFEIENKNKKQISPGLESWFSKCKKEILQKIILSGEETNLKHYLASACDECIEKLFISFKNYENLISDIVQSLPLSLEQFKVLEYRSIKDSILNNILGIKDIL